MEISATQVVLIFLVSAVIGMGSVLDSFQTHRPLIACTLIGLVLGDVHTGILLGGTLEFIAFGWMNIGAAQSPDSALASVISTLLVILGSQPIATGIAIALPIAAAGQALTVIARTITVFFQHVGDRYAAEANFHMLDCRHICALVTQALRVAIPALLVALFASSEAIQTLLQAIPTFITSGLQVASGFVVVVGFSMVINMMGARYLLPFFFLGFVIAGFTNFNLVAFGVIGAILAIVYVQLNPKFQKPVVPTSNSVADDEFDDE